MQDPAEADWAQGGAQIIFSEVSLHAAAGRAAMRSHPCMAPLQYSSHPLGETAVMTDIVGRGGLHADLCAGQSETWQLLPQ